MPNFQKNTPISRRNNTISEYIGSHIYNLIGIKRRSDKSLSPPKISITKNQRHNEDIKIKEEEKKEKEEIDPKVFKLDELVNKLMEISKYSRDQVVDALYGTSNNIENAYNII